MRYSTPLDANGDASSPTFIEGRLMALTEPQEPSAFYAGGVDRGPMASADFTIEFRVRTPIVCVTGDIDVGTIDGFRAAVEEAEASPSRAIIVSLTEARCDCIVWNEERRDTGFSPEASLCWNDRFAP
jgi:hypothetical protein